MQPTHLAALATAVLDVLRYADVVPAVAVLLGWSALKARLLAPRGCRERALVVERRLGVAAVKVLPPLWHAGAVQHPGGVADV